MQYITHTQTGKIYIIDNGCSPSQIYRRYNPEGMAISERSIGRLLSGEKKEVLGYRLSQAHKDDTDAVTYASEYDKDLATRPKMRKRQPMQCYVQLTETGRRRMPVLQGLISDLAYFLAATGTATEYNAIAKHFGWSRAYTSTKVSYMLQHGLVTLKKESGAINK